MSRTQWLFWASLWFSLTGCSFLSKDETHAQQGIIYCSEGSPESFNPQLATSGTVTAVSHQIYNRLLEQDPVTGVFIPSLATSWTVNDASTKYRFKLRHNVSFHQTDFFQPTRDFNADDVVFTFKRIIDIYHPYRFVNGGIYPYFQSIGFTHVVKSVQKVADDEVEFLLHTPDSSFLSTLSTDFAAILSEEYGAQLELVGKHESIDNQPIGTGPFQLTEFQYDSLIRFQAHKKYWQGPPSIDHLVFDITSHNASRLGKLITGECDLIAFPSAAELELINDRPEIRLEKNTTLNVSYWAFNTKKPPFDNPKVRQALALAVNRDSILQSVYFGHATLAKSILPPVSWAFDQSLKKPEFNLEKAAQLLKEADVHEGFEMDIWAIPVSRPYNPNATKMAELLQADLAQLGIKANIISMEWATFRKHLNAGEHDSVLIGWSADNADPDNFFRPLLSCTASYSGQNRAQWCDPDFDRLLQEALTTTDVARRIAMYHQLQQLLQHENPVTPIAHSLRYQATRTNVSGVEVNQFGGISFYRAKKVAL